MSIVVIAGEFIGNAALSWMIEKALDTGGKRFITLAKQNFPKLSRTISDKYRRLSPEDLLAFYHNENSITIPLDGDNYVIPASFAIEPTGSGLVSEQRVRMKMLGGLYSLPPELDAFSRPVRMAAEKDKWLHDRKNTVSLRSISHFDGEVVVEIQQGSYFDGISTNFAMDNIPTGRTESLREYLHGASHSLGNFQSSPLANHVGVVFMIESADGMLIAQQRSAKVANRPNSTSSSASGTLEWTDIPKHNNDGMLIDVIIHGAIRELVYELGVNVDINKVYFLGALRDYERGGMADFYFFAKSDKSILEIQSFHKSADESEESKSILGFEFNSSKLSAIENSRINFQKRVRKIIEVDATNQNLTFFAGTLLAARFILGNTPQLVGVVDEHVHIGSLRTLRT